MKIKILAIFYILLIGNSCIDDKVQNDFSCEKEGRFLGDFPIMEKTDSLFPYEAGKSLIFVDSLGNEALFIESEPANELSRETIVRTICGGAWLNVHEFDYYIEHQKRARYFSYDISANLYVVVSSNYLEITDTSFIPFDYFSVSVDWSFMQLGYMSEGGDISAHSPFLTESFVTENIGDTTLLGRPFTEVLKSKQIQNPVFYSRKEGLVAFRSHENILWVYDRAE